MLNPFGLKDNDPQRIVRVEDVDGGLACNCYCPSCRERLEAVQGYQKQWHFRHHKASDCKAGYETAIHIMAKQALLASRSIRLPYLPVYPSSSLWRYGSKPSMKLMVVNRQLIKFDRVEVEVNMGPFIPDAVAWKRDRRLLVEFVVTHGIDKAKFDWIRENNFAAVEVQLSHLGYNASFDEINECLQSGYMAGTSPKVNAVWWVHHPLKAAKQEEVDRLYLESIR